MIIDEDVVQLFQNLLNTPGGYLNPAMAGRTLQIFRGTQEYPWINQHPGGCNRHHIVFYKLGAIPKYCFDCYKVAITPRTVMELFKLLMVFEKISLPNDNSRKCMVEGRDACSGIYKGYVYCRSIEEGKAVRKIVQSVVSDDISPQVAVTLKRGCSEFAQKYPRFAQIKLGSARMEYKKEWQSHEDFVDKDSNFRIEQLSDTPSGIYPPSDIYSLQYWLRYAATIGDISYLPIAGMTLPPIPNLKRPPFTGLVKKNK